MNTNNHYVLIAAVIAACASVFSIVINVYYGRINQRRDKHSALISAYLSIISGALHEIVAIQKVIVIRKSKSKSITSWEKRDKESIELIEKVQKETRYIFGDLVCGFREIIRLRTYVSHHVDRDINHSKKLVSAGDELRVALDNAILDSYKRGDFPSRKSIKRVKLCVQKLRQLSGFGINDNVEFDDSLLMITPSALPNSQTRPGSPRKPRSVHSNVKRG